MDEDQFSDKEDLLAPPEYSFHRSFLQAIHATRQLEASGLLPPSAGNSDLQVDVDGTVISCKRYLLPKISPVFRHVLSTCQVEDKTLVLDSSEEFKATTFHNILKTVDKRSLERCPQ